jgi:hypothetical protein
MIVRARRGRRRTESAADDGEMRLVRAVASLVLAVALVGSLTGETLAYHGGSPIASFIPCDRPVVPPRCVSVGDNSLHLVYIDESVPEALADSMRSVIAEVYGATSLRMVVQRQITAATDVIVSAADYGQNGAAGWVWCPPDAAQGVNTRGHRWCRHQELHFNLNPRYASFFADDASRRSLSCHELGHTIGLRHWGNPPISDGPTAATCMNADTPNGPTALHQWDREHIAAYYPSLASLVSRQLLRADARTAGLHE